MVTKEVVTAATMAAKSKEATSSLEDGYLSYVLSSISNRAAIGEQRLALYSRQKIVVRGKNCFKTLNELPPIRHKLEALGFVVEHETPDALYVNWKV